MSSSPTATGIVALFNTSDDTTDMVVRLLANAGTGQTLVWCHFSDLRRGIVDFETYMSEHNPEVVIFDLSPPYDENCIAFDTLFNRRDYDAVSAMCHSSARGDAEDPPDRGGDRHRQGPANAHS